MDLTKEFPRSGYDMLCGVVILPRVIDKAKAFNADTMGEYHYDCGQDKMILGFLDVTAEDFAAKVKELETDEAVAEWVNGFLKKSQAEKDEFNNNARHNGPQDAEKLEWFNGELEKMGAADKGITTYFDMQDADEKRF